MKILRLSSELEATIILLKTQNSSIGFVPTMGALHQGHISLIKTALSVCDTVVCSIFVNPVQFNDPKDFERYPKTEADDCRQLGEAGCHYVFIPAIEEVYSPGFKKEIFSFGKMENVMEGSHRPGHFSGVAMVVNRLFELVKPDKAFFGLKDYQQYCIIKELVIQKKLPVEIIGIATMRESDGLAMSSRNRLLKESERKEAVILFQLLNEVKKNYAVKSVSELQYEFEKSLSNHPAFKLDYFEIADGKTLQPLMDKSSSEPRAFVATFIGSVRLIDNISLV